MQAIRYACLLIEVFRKANKLWDEIIIEKKGLRFWLHFAVRPEKGKDKNRVCIDPPPSPFPSKARLPVAFPCMEGQGESLLNILLENGYCAYADF